MTEADFVAVVDDDAAVRESLALMLGAVDLQVRAYAHGGAFLDDPQACACGCLLLDLRLPGMSGLELQRRVAAAGWGTPVIFLSGYADVPSTVQAMTLGAVDFLVKPVKEQQLLDQVQRCLERWQDTRRRRLNEDVTAARLSCLTPRESEVLDLLVQGRRSKEIAAAMHLRTKTVEEYRSNILRKMHVASTAELMWTLWGAMARLLSLPYSEGRGSAAVRGRGPERRSAAVTGRAADEIRLSSPRSVQ